MVGTRRDDDTIAAFEASPDPSAPDQSDQETPLPATVGRFQILARLGAGGMGEVFTAYDDRLDRKVAVKVVHRSGVGTKAQSRMLREAQALAKVSHPNVVAVHEVGEHRGDLYIAMELIRGETLGQWSAEGRPWREVVEVYSQAAAGLSAAHEAGLVHRDFKPDNAIVGEDGRVRVLDFGLARQSHAAEVPDAEERASTSSPRDDRLTQTGVTAGTPAYMAPEQIRHQPLSAATDQFSFCVALYDRCRT
ncbi:MAG: serine/threonine-protein kinase [Myxococcota bacterium]